MESKFKKNHWLTQGVLSSRTYLRLFCFPYAGGGALIYRQWQENMPEGVEVCPVQLPGREDRISEPPFTKLSSLVQTMIDALSPYLDVPFAFFGHSLGAKIAFEFARELRRKKNIQPVHFFASGSLPPHIPEPRPLHHLSEQEFINELRRYSTMSETVLQNKELKKMFLPILRADFSLDETYIYYKDDPLNCPISVLGGTEDKEASQEELAGWRQHTLSSFNFQSFPGDHFFIKSSQSLVLNSISQVLSRFT